MSFSVMPPRRSRAAPIPPPKRRRKMEPKIEEIKFNIEERQDYLSGFHKRKIQRQKQAKAEATKKEHEDKLAARKALREERKADLERHVEAVNAVLSNNDGERPEASQDEMKEEWDGIEKKPEVLDRKDEYVDEAQFTTVTVEAVDVDRDGMKTVTNNLEEDEVVGNGKMGDEPSEATSEGQDLKQNRERKKTWTKESKPKARKKQFKYESKADRKITRFKERGKGKKQAKERKSK